MATKTIKSKKTRFDTRLSKEQKLLFERAAAIGGYRSLTHFIISTVDKKARKIFKERETILASKRDSEIFFKAISKAKLPNKRLIAAMRLHKKLLVK
ncbi:MAG: DUF1778 domain-containing protein [Bacteroidetes bacterium]|nr:DUF1778 domain-containing protein [Bacteroidota bacterium]